MTRRVPERVSPAPTTMPAPAAPRWPPARRWLLRLGMLTGFLLAGWLLFGGSAHAQDTLIPTDPSLIADATADAQPILRPAPSAPIAVRLDTHVASAAHALAPVNIHPAPRPQPRPQPAVFSLPRGTQPPPQQPRSPRPCGSRLRRWPPQPPRRSRPS
ncbi:hypothetical protein [Amycolatopsis plumensis]|uniref:hypothetical protein n=1 Tax=Amycolatopsis plumensis TaxID=236508 RepID=UPI00360FB042